ncbi:carbohydrate ABC transporter permease [Paenibacillus mendelii]|uniref:Carbohydrate ABC transporter permease n=1 Tax=Paenibacillus mendelii TaxID=206163 RepID=A0ABV6J9B7_9BACL|nr:carbohydrate ABC transporter permease [Paenibacillus mendelii]MCQ6561278.1 carbohydrate ABC transporter permease [Paenibacillus mendelii]
MKTRNTSDRILLGIFYCVITLFAFICVLPFWLLISSSVTDELSLIQNGYNLIPTKLSFEAYRLILNTSVIYKSYAVTLTVTIVGTVISLIVTSGIAYAISEKRLKYAGAISFFLYLTILFNGGLVAYYLLIVKYLHMGNTIWALILPGVLSPYYVYMLRNFFRSVPESLSESARIDGANDMTVLLRIIIPVSLPAMSTIGLFYAIGFWNEWFRALLFIEKPELYPLQYIIMSIIRNVEFASSMVNGNQQIAAVVPAFSARMATTVITIGPIIFLYPFLQRYFIRGLVMGAVKG